LALTGEAYGIPSELAESLVTQSCVGAGMLARSANRPPAVLRQEVCVPGGSTEKAIAELNVSHFQSIIRAAAEKSLAANRAMANTDT
jgi:pyrroline-5-carboxylate reductase